jgi:hypothetical protein
MARSPTSGVDALVARLTRSAYARSFSPARFRRLLATSLEVPEPVLLKRLLAEWADLELSDVEATEAYEQVERVHHALTVCMGARVSLLTALVHALHTRRQLLVEPRLVSARDLDYLRANVATDPLTGLYTQRYMLEVLKQELSRAQRSDTVVSLIRVGLQGLDGATGR